MRGVPAVILVLGLTAWASTAWCQVATVDFLACETIDVGNVVAGNADDPCALVTMENEWELTEVHYTVRVVAPAGLKPVPGKWSGEQYEPPASASNLSQPGPRA